MVLKRFSTSSVVSSTLEVNGGGFDVAGTGEAPFAVDGGWAIALDSAPQSPVPCWRRAVDPGGFSNLSACARISLGSLA